MKLTLLNLLLSATLVFGARLSETDLPTSEGKLWVLLAAGSSTWGNYRHQADVCHAYQIVKAHGVPEENIIVFMKDDIAHNQQNVNPGVIINRPGGPDVYKGVSKDYVGDNLRPELFLAALGGNANATKGKKVINSGPADNIFVYFADHGASALSEFGESTLKATDLIKTINEMSNGKKYNKMVFYWESCESGSMLDQLDDSINVFATTAASPSESSYACYWSDKLSTYLGDVYSVKWMEDSDKEYLNKETLGKQYRIVKKETNTSHVHEYGDLRFGKLKLSEFQGSKQAEPVEYEPLPHEDTPVPTHEVPRYILERRLLSAKTEEESEAAFQQLRILNKRRSAMNMKIDQLLESSVLDLSRDMLNSDAPLPANSQGLSADILQSCYYRIVDLFGARCYKFGCNDYLTKALSKFATWCEKGYPAKHVLNNIQRECENPKCGVN